MLIEKHPDIHSFLHSRLIPDWIDGKISLDFDHEFVEERGWEYFVTKDGFSGSITYGFSSEDAGIIIDNYFSNLKKEDDYENPEGSEKTKTIEEMYENDPENTAKLIMTGYEIIKILTEKTRDMMSGHMWGIEENFANYVCTAFAGVSVDDFSSFARQDEDKFLLARQLSGQRSKEESTEDLKRVGGYSELREFWISTYKK